MPVESRVSSLESRLGTSITNRSVRSQSHRRQDTVERVFIRSGQDQCISESVTRCGCCDVATMLRCMLPPLMRPPEPPSNSSSALAAAPSQQDERVVFVPTAKVGYLIGYAGRTVSGFERRSGAKVDVLRPNSREDETPVALTGTDAAVARVVR